MDGESSRKLSRREFLEVAAGFAGTGALLAGCVGGSSERESNISQKFPGTPYITLATWGGTTTSGIASAWGTPFTKRTGIPVRQFVPVDYGKLKAMVESGDVTWDWVDSDGYFVWAHPELCADLDYKTIGITQADTIGGIGELVLPKAVGSYLTSFVISYRTDLEGPKPSTWEQFFDTKVFPGVRSLYNWPPGTVEIALLGDGVPYESLYPLDIDRAFRKIESIKSDLVFWNSGAESQEFLLSKAVDFMVPWDNRIGYLAAGGLPVTIEWNEQLLVRGLGIVPEGTPHYDAMMVFLQIAFERTQQVDVALRTGVDPIRKGAVELVDPTTRRWLCTYPPNYQKRIGIINDQYWGENLDAISKEWYGFVGTL